MIAFVGLGNVGDQYSNTKHNAGFWALDEYAKRNKMVFEAGNGQYVYAKRKNNKVLLVKPTTMMNKSGIAVKEVMDHWCLLPSDVFVMVSVWTAMHHGCLSYRGGGPRNDVSVSCVPSRRPIRTDLDAERCCHKPTEHWQLRGVSSVVNFLPSGNLRSLS